MRILHLQLYPCVRQRKIREATQKARPTWRVLHETFEADSPHQIGEAIARANPDIVHVHNEPDWPTIEAVKAFDGPVIHDVHDLASMRFKVADLMAQDRLMEVRANTRSAAVVYATPQFAEWGSGYAFQVPKITLHSAVSEDLYTDAYPGDGQMSIAYQGGVSVGDEGYPYRHYLWEFAKLGEMGFDVGVYPMRAHDLSAFQSHPAITVYETHEYTRLLTALARYHYAFVGFNFEGCDETTRRYCHACLPNKFFDAMAAGVPVIVRNCDTVAKIVRKYNLGIVWEGEENVHARAKEEWRDLRKNVLAERGQFSMEAQIPKLIALYEEVLGA